MKVHWQTAVLATFLAIFTWYLVTGREKVETWITVPVEMLGAQEGMIIHEGFVNQLEIRVRGPRELVRSLNEQKLGYPLDVSELKVGQNSIELDSSLLGLSKAYEIMEFKPSRLILALDRESTKNVPVDLVWAGEKKLNPDYKLKKVKITPALVELVGPESVLKETEAVEVTLAASFEDKVPATWSTDVPVILEPGIEAKPGLVRVELELGPKTQVIPVKVRDFSLDGPSGLDISIRTKLVTLEIEGPVFLFRNDAFRKDISVTALVKETPEPGKMQLQYTVSLPENCKLVSSTPETLTAIVKYKK